MQDMHPMPTTHPTQNKKAYLLLILLSFALFLPGITHIPLMDRDAAYFAQATKQMMESGNYFQVRYQNKTRFQKPPGINWLQAASAKTFSSAPYTTVWPYRLPSVLGGLLAILFCFAFARRFSDTKTATIAASLLAASTLMIVEAHMAITDAPQLASIIAMQACLGVLYHRYREQQTAHWGWGIGFWLAMGIGITLKGPAPLFGLLTLATLMFLERDIQLFKITRPLPGILVLLLSLSWLIPVSVAENSNYLWQIIHRDLMPKLAGGVESHGQPPGFFILLFFVTFWPGSLFIWKGAGYGYQHRQNTFVKFLLAWIIPSWIFFELMPTKLPQYVLPIYPAIAMLCAIAITQAQATTSSVVKRIGLTLYYILWGLLSIALATVMVMVAFHYVPTTGFKTASLIALVAIVAGAGVALFNVMKQRFIPAVIACVLMSVIFFGVMLQWAFPSASQVWLSPRIAALIADKVPDGLTPRQPLVSFRYKEPSLVFYLGTHNVRFATISTADDPLQYGKNAVFLLDKSQIPLWQQRLQKDNLSWQPIATIDGVNYSKGRKDHLILGRVFPKQ
jgi:4-amino-4-deoxy-L-arabinose transferase-like glycosyltransferase